MAFLRCVVIDIGIGIVMLAIPTHAERTYGQAQTTQASPRPTQFKLLFPRDGRVTEGWHVRTWADTKDAPRYETVWEARDGILYGGKSATGEWVGTWLLSDQEYENFVLEVDFKFKNGGATGNGGLGLRTLMTGRPSQNAMELQITDPRYEFSLYRHAGNGSLTGAIYKALAPLKQVYNPGEWNLTMFRAEHLGD